MFFTTIFSPLKFNVGCKSASVAFGDKITRNTAQACVTFPPSCSRIAGWPIRNVYFSLKRSLIACLPLARGHQQFFSRVPLLTAVPIYILNLQYCMYIVQYGTSIGNSLKTERYSPGPRKAWITGAWITGPGLRGPGLRGLDYGVFGGLVCIFHQRKINFSTIVVWIWIQQVLLDSWATIIKDWESVRETELKDLPSSHYSAFLTTGNVSS